MCAIRNAFSSCHCHCIEMAKPRDPWNRVDDRQRRENEKASWNRAHGQYCSNNIINKSEERSRRSLSHPLASHVSQRLDVDHYGSVSSYLGTCFWDISEELHRHCLHEKLQRRMWKGFFNFFFFLCSTFYRFFFSLLFYRTLTNSSKPQQQQQQFLQ